MLTCLWTAERQGRKLENITLNSSVHDAVEDKTLLSHLFDFSLLKFQQRDDLAGTFRKYSRKVRWL